MAVSGITRAVFYVSAFSSPHPSQSGIRDSAPNLFVPATPSSGLHAISSRATYPLQLGVSSISSLFHSRCIHDSLLLRFSVTSYNHSSSRIPANTCCISLEYAILIPSVASHNLGWGMVLRTRRGAELMEQKFLHHSGREGGTRCHSLWCNVVRSWLVEEVDPSRDR